MVAQGRLAVANPTVGGEEQGLYNRRTSPTATNFATRGLMPLYRHPGINTKRPLGGRRFWRLSYLPVRLLGLSTFGLLEKPTWFKKPGVGVGG